MSDPKKKPLYTLYEGLKANNYDVPDNYDSFERTLTEAGDGGAKSRRTLYKSLHDEGYDVPDTYEHFYLTLFTPVNSTTSRAVGSDEPAKPKAAPKPAATAPKATPAPQKPQAKPQPKPAPKAQAKPQGLTDAQKAQMMQWATGVVQSSKKGVEQTMRKVKNVQTHMQQRGKQPVRLGQNRNVVETPKQFNPETGKMESTYITAAGNEYKERAFADEEQNKIDEYQRQQYAMSADGQLEQAYAEQKRLEEALRKRQEEIDSREGQGFADFMRNAAAASSTGGGLVGEHEARTAKYDDDEEYSSLMAAARKNRDTIQLLEDRKTGNTDSFWHSLGTTMANGYTFTDGMSEMRDAIALQRAVPHMEAINKKRAEGKPLTKEEETAEAVLKNFSADELAQGMFGDQYGKWARAGSMFSTSIDMTKDISLAPGAGSIAKGTYKAIAGLGAKTLAKSAADGMAKGVAKATARGLLKATGVLVGAHTAGAAISNTSGIGRTGAAMATNASGSVGKDKNGNYTYEKGMDLLPALVEAERQQTRENGSEMFGEFIPGIGPVAMAGLKKMGLSKVADALTSVGNKQWYKQYSALLERGGWNGLPGEAIEEYEGSLFDALTGHAEDAWRDMTDPQNHVDIWLGCATMGALLGAVPMIGQAGHTAQYYRYKHKTHKSDRAAANIFGDDRWEPLRDQIDGTDNANMAGVVTSILQNDEYSTEDKAAALNYVRDLTKMRGYNIGQVNSAASDDEEHTDADAVNDSYAQGYETTDGAAMNDAKTLLDMKREALAQSLGLESADEVDNYVGDPLRYVEEQRQLGNTDGLDAVLDYANAKSVYDGMVQRVRDDIDSRVAESDSMVANRTNRSDGMIHPAVMKTQNADGTDRRVYVVSGNVVMLDDGTGVDKDKSDQSIIIRDEATGKLEQVSPDAIFSMDAPIDAEQEKEAAAENIRQQFADEAAAKIDGTVTLNAGDTYTIITPADGQQHTVTIVADENGQTENPDGTVNMTFDGQPGVLPKETLQAGVDVANRQRLQAEQPTPEQPTPDPSRGEGSEPGEATETPIEVQGEQPVEVDATLAPDYNLNDEVTLRNGDTTVRGSIVGEENEDGLIEVWTEEPIDGKKINLFTREQLDAMLESSTPAPVEAAPTAPVATEAPVETESLVEAPQAVEAPAAPVVDTTAATVENTETPAAEQPAEEAKPTALSQIPVGEDGQPMYEQATPDLAWDGLVEQTEGDEAMAKEVADDMVKDKEAALKKAQKQTPKQGSTIAEKIAERKRIKADIDKAQSELDHWKQVAGTQTRRTQEAESAARKEEEAKRKAAAEEAARLKAEQEEAERKEREALEGVPDWTEDTPSDARARGYRRSNGHKYDRQEPVEAVQGKETEVKFADNVKQTGHAAVIDASQLQPSHVNGQLNVQHFIPEAQPKARTDAASVAAADKIASNINPEEITSMVTAYTGAPTVNSRGEVIQGNNRSAALKTMWQSHKEQGEKYKQYLIEHAEELGLDAEAISKMENPTLVNMVDVDDAKAIELGQYVASDTESGGTERIKAQNAVQKMGEDMKTFAGRLLSTSDEDASFSQLVDKNGVSVLQWMSQKGYITPTQYKSAFDTKGNLTGEAANDLKGIMYQSIFQGGSTQLEEMFNRMPAKAQRAILATAYRDYDSPKSERMNKEIQNSIMAFNDLMHDEGFAGAKNFDEARRAIEMWKRQYQFDDATGESYLPTDKFSNFALTLAAMYKGSTQTFVQSTFNRMYDLIQGTQEVDLFNQDTIDNTPRTLAEAIKEVLNIDYDGQARSNALAGSRPAGQERGQGSQRDTGSGEPGAQGDGNAQRGGGAGAVRDAVRAEGTAASRNADKSSQDNQGKPQGQRYTLSTEKAGNGEPFYQDENGSIDLVTVDKAVFDKIGYQQAPFRLTPSMIEHMLGSHAKELGFSTVDEAVDFVMDVMHNFDHVRLGYDGALVFSIENGRNRTGKRAITILINSDSGKFYGLKTSGYEAIKGLEKRPLLWERGAKVSSSTDAASASVPTSKSSVSGEQSGSASNQSNASSSEETTPTNSSDRHLAEHQDGVPDLLPTQASGSSEGKGTENPDTKQGNGEENSQSTVEDGVEDEYEEVDDNGGLSQEIADKARDYEGKHGDTVVFVKDGERYVVVGQSADFMMPEYDSDGSPMEFNQKEVGEAIQKALDGDMKAVVMEDGKVVREETGNLPAAELQDLQSRVSKIKAERGEDVVVLVRHGSGYVAVGDDAATVQQVTKTRVRNDGQSTFLGQSSLNYVIPGIVKAGHKVTIVDGVNKLQRKSIMETAEQIAGEEKIRHDASTAQRKAEKALAELCQLEAQSIQLFSDELSETDKDKKKALREQFDANNKTIYEKKNEARLLLKNLSDDALKKLAEDHADTREVMGVIEQEQWRRADQRTLSGIADKLIEEQGTLKGKPKGKFDPMDYASTDKARPILMGIHHEDGVAVATDGNIVLVDKKGYKKSLDGKTVDKDGKEIPGAYPPNWRKVCQHADGVEASVSMSGLRERLAGARALLKANGCKPKYINGEAIVLLRMPNGEMVPVRLGLLEKLAKAGEYLGTRNIGLDGRVLYVDNGKGSYALLTTVNADMDTTERDSKEGKIVALDFSRSPVSTAAGKQGKARLQKVGVTPSEDAAYMEAVERGDMETAQRMVNEAAKRNGYATGSDYQGTSAFNGAAPYGNGYFLTKQERKEAWESGDFEGESTLGDYIDNGVDGGNIEELTNAASYRAADEKRKEAIESVRDAVSSGSKTIRMYRSVPSSVKEGSFRNGDWVTPSRKYAEENARLHGWGENYHIIEQDVPVDEVWFDGNDIAEWGYGREEDYANDTDFAYKNTRNNRKLLAPVTYDNEGRVIPLSERFNEGKADERYHRGETTSRTPSPQERALRDAVSDMARKAGIEVIEDETEGQRVLDMANGEDGVRLMGSKTNKKMAEVGVELEGRELTKEQQSVADVFSGKADNQSFTVNREDGTKTIVMRQGNDAKAGTKHSLYGHYGTTKGVITADDIVRIPEIVEKGERTTKRSTAQYKYHDEETNTTYTVVTNTQNGREEFADFYTNKKAKPSDALHASTQMEENSDTPGGARTDDNASSAAKVGNNSETGNNAGGKIREQRVEVGGQPVRFFRTANGEAYGFTVGGKIYIDPRIATAETPVHEYAHLWGEALRNGNPKEWQNVVSLMKGTSVWEEVKERYPELKTDDEIADEVLATYSGRKGAERLRAEQQRIAQSDMSLTDKAAAIGALEGVKQALKKFWKAVADFLHIHYTSAEEVADRVLYDLLSGTKPTPNPSRGEGRAKRSEADIEAVNTRFNERLDELVANPEQKGRILQLGSTNKFLREGGLEDAEIELEYDKLVRKSKEGYKNNHPFSPSDIKDLPKAIQSPIAVFEDTNGKNNASVILTELKKDGHNFIVAVRAEAHNRKGGRKLVVNEITTLFPKEARGIVNWINQGKWTNMDKEKALSWLEALRNHRGTELTEEELNSAAKIVKDFNTPKYSEENLSGQSNDIRYQFAGERGAREADRAEEVTTRMDNLGVAREMEAAKKDAKAIKLATGWERGADGKWRYEMPDVKMDKIIDRYKEQKAKIDKLEAKIEELKKPLYDTQDEERELVWKANKTPKETARLDELRSLREEIEDKQVLPMWREVGQLYSELHTPRTLESIIGKDHPVLKAYPQLRETEVEINALGRDTYGSAHDGGKLIRLNEDYMLAPDMQTVLAHEVQHAIQHIEGFAKGGTPEMMRERRLSVQEDRSNYLQQKADIEQTDDYKAAQQEIVDGIKSYGEIAAERVRNGEPAPTPSDFVNSLRQKAAQRHPNYRAWSELMALLGKMGIEYPIDDFDGYRSLGGEVEARNVEKRMAMTPEERRNSLASETEDVSREDQIFLFGEGGESASMSAVQPLRPDTPIRIVEGAKEHGFKNFGEAKEWAKTHIARTYNNDETGGKGEIRISNTAIDKYLSQSAVDKSASKDVHLSVLKVLPDVIRESVDAEQHPDFKKGSDGIRSAENGINSNVTIHRLFGAVTIDGKQYRVKVTVKEDHTSKEPKVPHSYEATKIELLAGTLGNSASSLSPGTNNSISAAKLLKGVEKSNGSGEKFFEEVSPQKFAERHGLDASLVEDYASAMRNGNYPVAYNCRLDIGDALRDGRNPFAPETHKHINSVMAELDQAFGNIKDMRETYEARQKQNEEEAKAQREAARKEAEQRKEREHKDAVRSIHEQVAAISTDESNGNFNPRVGITPVRGAWTKDKVRKRLKEVVGTRTGYDFAARLIAEFDSPEELAAHMFYHGTVHGGGRLKPSVLMSDREIEQLGGGGYGDKYWGVSVSKSKKIASNFSGTSNNIRIYPMVLAKNARVIELPNAGDAADLDDYITDLWENGVDAVWIGDKNAGEQELCVINPKAIVNINRADSYAVYGLGTERNPLNIIDEQGIVKLYDDAKRYVEQKANAPRQPQKPSRYNADFTERKSDEQYAKDMAEYERKMEEYRNSQEYKDWEKAQREAADNIFFRTSDELTDEYGTRWLDEQTTDDGRHTTQVKNTINSYKKFGEWVKRDAGGRDVSVLDASSGFGLGTQWMRENGIKADDVEPYPSENREKPTFGSYAEINKKYDYIISNAVLNVIPDDWRANVLHDMADKMKVGGKMVINVRGAQSIREQGIEGKTKITLDDPSEILVLRPDGSIRAYQKGFTKPELKEWVESELGDGYTVEVANTKNAGGSYDTAVVVTKNERSSTTNDAAPRSGQPTRKGASIASSGAKVVNKPEAAKLLSDLSAEIDNGELGAHELLHEVTVALSGKEREGASTDKSEYYDLGGGVTLRVSDHQGNAKTFADRSEHTDNYGLVIKVSPRKATFKPKDGVDYLEYVYYPDKLTDSERQKSIVDGLAAFLNNGDYSSLPEPDRVNTSGKFHEVDLQRSGEDYDFGDGVEIPIKTPGRWRFVNPQDEYDSTWGYSNGRSGYGITHEAFSGDFESMHQLEDAARTKYPNMDVRVIGDDNHAVLSIKPWPQSEPRKYSARERREREAYGRRVRQQAIDKVKELAAKLHLDNVEIVEDKSTLEGKRATAKGFFNTKTGKITIVLDNHRSVGDVVKTLLHEAVAHYGLRQLFGTQFDTFLDNVYAAADESVRRRIVELAKKHNWDFRTATEEYLASLAESTDFERAQQSGWWRKIQKMFLRLLHAVGFDGYGDKAAFRFSLSDNELRYLLWRSYENLAEPGKYRSIFGEAADVAKQYQLKVGNYENPPQPSRREGASTAAETDVLFRDGDPEEHARGMARASYEHMVSTGWFQVQEAIQDSMLSLEKGMKAIMESVGEWSRGMHIEDVPSYENPYLGENALSSVNQDEANQYNKRYMQPLLDEVKALAKNADQRAELTDYMMAKHGLERNDVMARRAAEKQANEEFKDELRDAQRAVDNDPLDPVALANLDDVKQRMHDRAEELYFDNRGNDYAGLTALTGKDNVMDAEAEAARMVHDYESYYETQPLWDAVWAATHATLEKTYKSGMMSKDTYMDIASMYQNYIPLRGFDETTAEDAYAYLNHRDSVVNAPIKTAKGRKSKADDPLANIASMAETAIMQGNRNTMVKQRALNFALNYPSDLISVSDLWLHYDKTNDEWVPVFPDNIEDTDTPDEVEQKMKDFEEKMRGLREQYPDEYKSGHDTVGIPYRVVNQRDKQQHQVIVKRNGRDYVLTVNGNPRMAQALNGQTNPDNDMSGAVGKIIGLAESVNRGLASVYTTRNPNFIASNFIRDQLYGNASVWVKESPAYAARYNANAAILCNPLTMKWLLAKDRNGTLDPNGSYLERYYNEFMRHGGETGFTSLRDIEAHKKAVLKELKRGGLKTAWKALGIRLDELNRAVENAARFAAYVTSRQVGRDVGRSVWDAKEISVNFNKKGAGSKFMGTTGQTAVGNTAAFTSGLGRSLYVFWNAAVQGSFGNFFKMIKRHPLKSAVGAVAAPFVLGLLVGMIGYGGDDDDEKNKYANLPKSTRRQNICFKMGGQYITIPLPTEIRAIYGMGELAASVMLSPDPIEGIDIAKEMTEQISQILPIDFMEGGGGFHAFVPSSVKPIVEVAANESWTGVPIYNNSEFQKNLPEWRKAYKSANAQIVGATKWLNEVTGGDDGTKGKVDVNPAKIEYLLNGYFSGYWRFGDQLVKSAETAFGDRDFDWRDVPLANRVVKTADERNAYKNLNTVFYRYMEDADKVQTQEREYKKVIEDQTASDEKHAEYLKKLTDLVKSEDYVKAKAFQEISKAVSELNKAYKKTGNEVLEKAMYDFKSLGVDLQRGDVSVKELQDGTCKKMQAIEAELAEVSDDLLQDEDAEQEP